MIPLVAYLRVAHPGNGSFGVWIPLFLVWLLLAPFALLLAPVIVFICLVGEVDAWRAFATVWNVVAGLKKTSMEVAHQQTSILIYTL